MEKMVEFFDGWVKSQRDFLENWVRTQREFMESWTEATKKLQEAFFSQVGSQDGPGKEAMELYGKWISAMVNSSKVFTDEAVRIQETWKNTVEKQMEMSNEMLKSLSGLLMAGEKK